MEQHFSAVVELEVEDEVLEIEPMAFWYPAEGPKPLGNGCYWPTVLGAHGHLRHKDGSFDCFARKTFIHNSMN